MSRELRSILVTCFHVVVMDCNHGFVQLSEISVCLKCYHISNGTLTQFAGIEYCLLNSMCVRANLDKGTGYL